MLRGNCSSIYSEMAGKILSDVNGESDVYAATAKELNATSTDMTVLSVIVRI